MELVLIRHGEPAWTVDGKTRIDPGLTERGREQAILTGKRLAGEEEPVAEILVSPARRSQETAAPIVEATGVAPTTIDDLVEMRMPLDWGGQLEETVQQIFRDAQHRPPEEWWEGMPGGETFRGFHQRVTAVMERILADRSVVPRPDHHPHLWDVATDPRRIVVVAHGGTNAVALTYLLGVQPTPWEWERFILGHASMARLRAVPLAGAHVFSLRTFNDREHLAPELRTR